ncbi:MAG TPA: hypothetical protein VE783_06670 [Candidatus Limnocylindrales bacterium]|nr:hypothetical protein [Candidatus Limnocylindrales bacterium]
MAQIAKSRFGIMYALALAAVFTLSAISAQAQQTKSNIQAMTGWQNCTTCAGSGGAGPSAPHSMTQFQSSPSITGKAAKFWLGGSTPYSDALWWKQLGAANGTTHHIYDVYFYIKTPQYAQTLEFDSNQAVVNKKWIYGTQCSIKNHHDWDVWDTKGAAWRQTGIPCSAPSAYKWHHLTWEFKRDGSKNYFISVTLDGVKHYVNKSYYAKTVYASMLDVAFQMDGDNHQDDYMVWLDKVSLKSW